MPFNDQPYLFEMKKIGSSSIGFISVAENKDLPFPIERVYWTYFTPNEVIRGNHAHKSLKQILLAVSGEIKIETETARALRDFARYENKRGNSRKAQKMMSQAKDIFTRLEMPLEIERCCAPLPIGQEII
jgi:hypothetical protein